LALTERSFAMTLQIAQQPDADALLDRDPLALLVGMLLDQQFPMERAFAGPYLLAQRMGVDHLDAHDIAEHDPETFAKLFVGPPAIHRFPGAMAGRVQELARLLIADYDGRAEVVWEGAKSGADLHARVATLPGFGQQRRGFSLLCWENSVACAHVVGARPRGPTAKTAVSVRLPTSRAPSRCRRSAHTRKR
jgi:uncharacterized HhH-GPD family protein